MSDYVCKSARRLLALRSEAWSDDERWQVKTHLAECTQCAALARDYAEQDRVLVHTAPRVGLSVQQRASLLSQVKREKRWYEMGNRGHVVFKSAAAVAAIAALVLVLNWIFSGVSEQKEAQPGAPGPTVTMTATVVAPTVTPSSTPVVVIATPMALAFLSGPIFADQLYLESNVSETSYVYIGSIQQGLITSFALELTWRAIRPVDTDWSYFIHLVDRDDQLVWQQDAQGDWPEQSCEQGHARPTCVLVTEHQVVVPAEPGEYTLFVGLYDPNTMVRAMVSGGDDVKSRARLGRLVVSGPVETTPTTDLAYGIEADALLRADDVARMVNDLGLGWLKQEVRWAEIEPQKGQCDWTRLDPIVDACEAAGIRLLLTVIEAPVWARDGKSGAGPPDDAKDFADFMAAMAERYQGRVHAYEIWHSQNLASHWDGAPLSPYDYLQLLRAAYQAVKTADPDALVVSGGLEPTPVNDAEWAIDNLEYLEQLYAEGLKDDCDAVGVHADGYANPPDVYYQGGDFDPERETFDDHHVFFFRNTLEDSFTVMEENGDGDKPIWVTHFGWGTVDGLGMQNPIGSAFVKDIDEPRQAEYIVGAFAWAKAWGHVGGMFLNNLQVSPTRSDFGLAYSIVRPDGTPRPAFAAIKEWISALDTTP